jgi:hypothetical protein
MAITRERIDSTVQYCTRYSTVQYDAIEGVLL